LPGPLSARFVGWVATEVAFKKLEQEARRTTNAALRKAADPVVSSAKQKLSAYPGASIGTVGAKASNTGVFVVQRARKVTGLRPQFGTTQLEKVLRPAVDEHADEVLREVDGAFERLGREAGF